MLHPVVELSCDGIGNVDRVLRDEIDADTFRPDEPHDLFDLFEQRFGRVVEQQVRFVEEEAELGFFGIADFGKRLEQLAEQPQQERRIELGARHQLVGGEDVDHPAPVVVELEQVSNVERWFAEEMLAALAAQLKQRSLDRTDRLLRHIAIGDGQLVGLIGAFGKHRLQIVEVEQQQPFLVGDVEGDGQHAFLHFVQVHQACKQQRPHLAHGRADRVALFAEQVPELHRIFLIGPGRVADFGGARGEGFMHLARRGAGHGKARQVALYVRHEARNPDHRKAFDNPLQRDGLAGAGRPGDQAMAVGAFEVQHLRLGAAACCPDEDTFIRHEKPLPELVGQGSSAIGCDPKAGFAAGYWPSFSRTGK